MGSGGTKYANVASTLALAMAIGGVAYAGVTEGSVGPREIRSDAVRSRHVQNGSLRPEDLHYTMTDVMVSSVTSGSVAQPVTVSPGQEVKLFDLDGEDAPANGSRIDWGDGVVQVTAPGGNQVASRVTVTLEDRDGAAVSSSTSTVQPGETLSIPVHAIFDDPFFLMSVTVSTEGGSITVDRGSMSIIAILISL